MASFSDIANYLDDFDYGSLAQGALVGASALKVGASAYQGYAAKKASKAEAGFMERESNIQANRIRREAARVASSQRLSFMSNGIAIDGTAQLLIDETEALGEADALELISLGHDRASMVREQGSTAFTAGLVNATASAFDGTFTYQKAKKEKYFD